MKPGFWLNGVVRFGGALLLFLSLATSAARAEDVVLPGQPPYRLPAEKELRRLRSAVLYTERGPIYFELYPEQAPWHVANLKYLADRGFYRNSVVNVVESEFLVQAGVPNPSTPQRLLYSLPPEFNNLRHIPGALGMARRPNDVNPHRRSAGTQFHILLTEAPKMDGSYTIFGRVLRGLDVARKLQRGDLIRDFRVFLTDDRPPERR